MHLKLPLRLLLLPLLAALAVLVVILGAGAWEERAWAAERPVMVKLETSLGDIVLELYPDKSPVTVENFVQYVKDGFYDGTIFHRVIKNFMVQGGGLDDQMNQKATRPPIKNEADNGLANEPYTIAMARTAAPNSATSQFFINVANNRNLNHSGKSPANWGYAVFGKVVQGKEVVDKIKAVPTTSKGFYADVPVEPVIITHATVLAEESEG
ncbi:MAG: peptidyl-prolyl cis-trans isomerase [Deltaproteobacteria bacterium]|nr:peptidyl-prolyl cis-trans isomerase [Deltaproteobacteria bacterium]